MTPRAYKILTWVFAILSCVVAVLLVCTSLKLTRLRGEIRFANDIIWALESDRDRAAKGTTTEAADILWKLHFPSIHWPGEPEPFHDSVARLVEGRRRKAIADVIMHLRSKTADDLGSDPEVWILKYGSDLSKNQLTSMKAKVAGDVTGGGSNHADAPNAAMALLFHFARHWRGLGDLRRSLGDIALIVKRRNIWIAVALIVFAVASYVSYCTYIHIRRARMASQCALLTYDLGNHLAERHEAGLSSDADEYLAHYSRPGSLFHRDTSGQLVDSWEHPFVVTQSVQGDRAVVRVTSVGRDGALGTQDDFFRETAWDLK